jgi:hypothetical protein
MHVPVCAPSHPKSNAGRAAARQGYASAFTSFVKIANATGALEEIQQEVNGDGDATDESLLVFVRNQLLKMTDPSQAQSGKFGKVKGSEERDYQFGRLFGILGMVRSGILVPSGENKELSDINKVSAGLVNDLVELYHHKKWMREPTAHGIITLLNSFYDAGSLDDAKVVLDHLVRKAIVPKLFAGKGLDSLTAEQIAVAVSIQSHMDFFDSELPSPLDQAIASSATIPILVDALGATSSVVHPRMHVVWDVFWLLLTEEAAENARVRTLSESCPVSDESASEVVKALMQSLVTQSLLAIGTEGDGSNPTHERRALALTIVRAACGGTIQSSTAGPFVVLTDLNLLQDVILSQDIVKRLFLDVICAGNSSKGAHMLKPLALHVLDTIVESDAISDLSSSESLDRRLAIAKCLLVNVPHFDRRTKTATISNLLLLNESVEFAFSEEVGQMWNKYIAFLQDQILRTSMNDESDVDMVEDGDSSKPSFHETLGYIDLLFNTAKRILRLQFGADDQTAFEEFRSSAIRRILGFFMTSAFFDCSTLTMTKKSKKKKGRKQSFDGAEMHPVVSEGLRVKETFANPDEESSASLPYAVRAVLSSRFFSLLADCVSMATSVKPVASSSDDKQGKDARVFEVLSDVIDGWTLLEERGAESLASAEEVEGEEYRSKAIDTLKEFKQEAKAMLHNNGLSDVKSLARTRCTLGSAILASTLCLQFLRCGDSDEIVDEIDEDDGDDDEDIVEMITDLQRFPARITGADTKESSEEEESSPLLGLAELCIHVLSSPLGSGGQSRGASPKLLREAVKLAWIGGLSAYAAADDDAVLDDDVLNALLTAIGASPAEEMENDEDEGESDSGEEESDSDESEEDKVVFSQAAGEALGLDDDASDVEMKGESGDASDDEEEDVELDPAQLESLLLEDSDAILDDDDGIEVGMLEHHAGADAALAQLIKLKQDARKAGRQALERLVFAKQLRCMLLLDTLLSNPGRQWGNLLQSAALAKIILPLLQARKDMEKAIEKASANQLGKKAAVSDSEKRALVEKLTSLIKTKVCKLKWSRDKQPSSDDVTELSVDLMNQVRKSTSTEHASCCSSSLLTMLKSLTNVDDMIEASRVYSDALREWSTKRTTKLPTSPFDDLIQHLPRCVTCHR